MNSSLTLQRQPARVGVPTSALPDFYAEERWARTRVEARKVRARNALVLVGLLVGAAGTAGALRRWDAGLQP
jgi:hypothetical protein